MAKHERIEDNHIIWFDEFDINLSAESVIHEMEYLMDLAFVKREETLTALRKQECILASYPPLIHKREDW